MSVAVRTVAGMILTALLPVRCPVCGAPGCAPCDALHRPHAAGGGRRPVPAALDLCRSLLAYEGEARELVARLKYRNDRAALAWLAGGMAALVEPPAGVVVTWAPTGARRRRRRGFDQAELLAAAVARRWRVPCRRLLDRAPGPAQTGLTLAARRRGPSFVPAPGTGRAGGAVACRAGDRRRRRGDHRLHAHRGRVGAAGRRRALGRGADRRPHTPDGAVATLPDPSLPLSVPTAPPDVETSLKFRGQLADVQQ